MADKRPYEGGGSSDGVAKVAKLSIQEQIAAAKLRAAAVRDRLSGGTNAASQVPPPTAAAPAVTATSAAKPPVDFTALRAKLAAAKAGSRVTGEAPLERPSAPTPPLPQQYASTPSPPPTQDNARQRGGLGIGLHPALLGDMGIGTGKAASLNTKFSSTLGNKRLEPPAVGKGKKQLDLSAPTLEELKKDPYFDASLGAAGVARGRKSRQLLFNEKGKYIHQAIALRRQAALEQMKKRIAEQTRKAGLDEDRSEQAFVVAAPPAIEWWDEGIIEGDTYPDFDDDAMAAEQKLKINTEDTVITRYIQHPVLLEPPQEKNMPAPKPLPLTKEEQKKKRRQTRQAALKEKQAKIRLGLEEPDAPKVKKSNLMRVLGDQAVKDPTAVEARVNREIAERQDKHEATNEERKLTKEQQLEKLAANQEQDAARGVQMCVFRIDNLAYGKHRYKVDNNAKQQALTGITIMNPKLNLVIVEGGQHSIKFYKKLMLNRIDWTEIAPPREYVKEPNAKDDDITKAWWLKAQDDNGQLKDLSENRCVLVWEGQVKERVFKKWGSRVCETDGDARRALERAKMENMWQLAKNWSG